METPSPSPPRKAVPRRLVYTPTPESIPSQSPFQELRPQDQWHNRSPYASPAPSTPLGRAAPPPPLGGRRQIATPKEEEEEEVPGSRDLLLRWPEGPKVVDATRKYRRELSEENQRAQLRGRKVKRLRREYNRLPTYARPAAKVMILQDAKSPDPKGLPGREYRYFTTVDDSQEVARALTELRIRGDIQRACQQSARTALNDVAMYLLDVYDTIPIVDSLIKWTQLVLKTYRGNSADFERSVFHRTREVHLMLLGQMDAAMRTIVDRLWNVMRSIRLRRTDPAEPRQYDGTIEIVCEPRMRDIRIFFDSPMRDLHKDSFKRALGHLAGFKQSYEANKVTTKDPTVLVDFEAHVKRINNGVQLARYLLVALTGTGQKPDFAIGAALADTGLLDVLQERLNDEHDLGTHSVPDERENIEMW